MKLEIEAEVFAEKMNELTKEQEIKIPEYFTVDPILN